MMRYVSVLCGFLAGMAAAYADRLPTPQHGVSAVIGGVSFGVLLAKVNELEDRLEAVERLCAAK